MENNLKPKTCITCKYREYDLKRSAKSRKAKYKCYENPVQPFNSRDVSGRHFSCEKYEKREAK